MKMSPKEWDNKIGDRICMGKCLWRDTFAPLGKIACVELDNGEIFVWKYSYWTNNFTEEKVKE